MKSSCAGEEIITILMKRDRHTSIRKIECLFHSVTVVNVDVQIQNPRVNLQQLNYRQHNIVHVAKATRLRFLGVMQASSPVYRDISLPIEKQASSIDRGS